MPSSSISIHALLAESDPQIKIMGAPVENFYPRSPCGERRFPISAHCFDGGISIHALLAESDDIKLTDAQYLELFLSTLSLRRATPGSRRRLGRAGHFYPRSPCGERHAAKVGWTLDDNSISIHALLAESDNIIAVYVFKANTFLSTLSLRRATPKQPKHQTQTQYFYPRSPCGERHGFLRGLPKEHLFLSTLSLRRATSRLDAEY